MTQTTQPTDPRPADEVLEEAMALYREKFPESRMPECPPELKGTHHDVDAKIAAAEASLKDPRPASPVGVEALLPCPFCGDQDSVSDIFTRDGRKIVCKCGASMIRFQPKASEKAIAAWNTRAALTPPSVTGEAVPYGWIYETFKPGVDWCAPNEWWPAEFTRVAPNPENSRNVIALYAAPVSAHPVEVTIFCPVCSAPHIDEGEWATTRHHKTHQCQSCGHEWRPFPFATVGVAHPVSAHEGLAAVWVKAEHLKRILDAGDPMDGAMVWAEQRHPDFVPLATLSPTALEQGSGSFPAKEPEAEILATLLDNVVISQSLSKELRQNALDEARSYLYDRRQRQAAQTSDTQPGMETPEGVGMNPEKAIGATS